MSTFGDKADIARGGDHTFDISMQIFEGRVDQFLIQVNFGSLMRY